MPTMTDAEAFQLANEDESKVPTYSLPDPLQSSDGLRIETSRQWEESRRGEILRLFEQEVYGVSPGRPADMNFEVLEEDNSALAGKARKKVVRIRFGKGADSPYLDLCIYAPVSRERQAPIFIGHHLFDSRHVVPMPGGRILPENVPIPEEISCDLLPGSDTIYRILERGYAIGTIDPESYAPDDAERFMEGVIGQHLPAGQTQRGVSDWGSLAAWAWGLSRALDYLETDKDFDVRRVVAIGHSRRGKAALWAGATDPRFAAVIANESGCGGAALSKRLYGETVSLINRRFPHWFCENFRKYNDRETDLPVDQHMLIALLAPRPVYIGSAIEDRWADPKGEFLSAVHARSVYQLYGKLGLGTEEMPSVNQSIGEAIGYHVRTGKHALSDLDWMLYLDWVDHIWKAKL